MTDKWIWKHDTHEGYSVKGVYHIVNQNKQQDHAPFTELIWNKTMSLKCLFLRGELYIRGFRDQRCIKKRINRLKQKTMNDVVLVTTNSKLAKKKKARNMVEYSLDDIETDDE
ncbi:hypothetical protein MTR_4g074970 [Medicago truncatula]|uniref:Uncharacterized protein n=1 Tax=Medicago truncatula TaxID=3880 RepID=G7JNJ9_MEDTR|nr:hypothetical protein MTR_4g074970 [Medicago truncatula]